MPSHDYISRLTSAMEPQFRFDFKYSDSNQAMAALLIGRTAIGERVWDVCRVIDIAEKYFSQLIDFTELICLGNSGGGTVTFYAACADERITLAVPSCSVCTDGGHRFYPEEAWPVIHKLGGK